MTEDNSHQIPSEVATWHLLSGTPDNVTEDGEVVEADAGRRLRIERELLRVTIARLRAASMPDEVQSLGRLAASYLLAGDLETAARYVSMARDRLGGQRDEDTA